MARPDISLQAAIGTGTVPANVFIIGVSLLGGPHVLDGGIIVGHGTWVEIGDYCDGLTIRRGRQRLLEQYRAGTLVATLDNTDRRFDPTWTAGPYSDGGESRLRANAPIRVQATYLGVVHDMYYGFADGWSPQYTYPEGGGSTVAATDAFKVFQAIDLAEVAAQGASDTTGSRLNRILDAVGWSSTWRDFDTGTATHMPTTLEGNVATQMRTTVDSERGDLYIAGNGTPTERGRYSRFLDSRSRFVQWVVGDGDGELNPSAFQPANDEALVRNDVQVARVGGSVVVRRSSDAETYPHRRRLYARADLTLADDDQVVSYADWVLRLFAVQEPRIDWVEFEPDGDDSLWSLVLGARIGDRVQVRVRHPFDGSLWSGDYFVEGFDHDIPVLANGRWRTRFYLADASQWPTSPFIIGVSLLGGTDVLI